MLKNYFKIAWRSLWKNKIFSIINIFGLSVGIAFAMLIGAYVWGELQVNHQLKNADNQYIILSKWKDPNMGIELTSIAQLPKTLRVDYPGLVANYYHDDLIGTNVSRGNQHFREGLQVGDSTLLKMYGFKLVEGDEKTALNDPFSVVMTTAMAIKYFGRTDIVGQTLNFESFSGDKHDFTITGVLQKTPQNSVINVNDNNNSGFFFNADASKYFKRSLEGWNNPGTVDYVELQKNASPALVEKAMHELLQRNAPAQISKNLTPYLVSLKDYNLVAENGLIRKMTYTLSCIALFILLMATVNFVNICIGRSSGRMKEMGIRKVLGSMRKQLVLQFLTESVILVMVAMLVALGLYIAARPYFSGILGKEIMSLLTIPVYFIPIPFLFALFVGLLAGIYPALVLSAINSVDSLKGKLTSVKENVLSRKALIAFQFATAIIVFIGAMIISQQINLFFSSNLGYNKDYVVYAQLPRDWSPKGVQKMEAIRSQLAQMPQISSISLSYEIPNGNIGNGAAVYRQGADPSHFMSTANLLCDNQYAATYSIPLKAGAFFKPVYNAADSTEVVINQTASKALGWADPGDAIGQKIMIQGNPVVFTISGVVADFHLESMQVQIKPVLFTNVNYAAFYRYFSIRLKPGDIHANIEAVQKKWAELLPGAPFEYSFMDDALAKLYKTEIQLKKAAYVATILAVIIVLLGVLGLISLSIQKRTKEIGIRKVLGSSVAGISSLFLKEFLGIVLIAGIIACPVAYLIMQNWLNDYAYKINLTLHPFIIAITSLVFLTTFLIIVQTIKAAFSNPVKSLRSE